jgi:hypothetical protein
MHVAKMISVVGVGVYLYRLLHGVACICVLLWCRLLIMNMCHIMLCAAL